MTEIQNYKHKHDLNKNVSILCFDGFVKSTKFVMPDLIPAEDGIFDRHPEAFEFTGFRLSPE